MGLKPLEFSDCLLDSPYFRDNINDHERELDETNNDIKTLIKECKNLIRALEGLMNAQTKFAGMLQNFRLRYIGEVDGDCEMEYEDSFPYFAGIIERIEEERKRMLEHAQIQLIDPLDKFRREQIGKAKDEKRKFDKETERMCALLESHTKINPKRKSQNIQEADAQLEHELRNFRDMSLAYVSKLHEVNEKKKFEFVEIMLAFIYGQATFFHNGHDVFCDSRQYLTDLQYKLQRTRENFDITKEEAEELKTKTTRRFNNGELHKGAYSREGYLFVHEKKKSVASSFTTTFAQSWMKHYCVYTKENKILSMQPYTQTQGKLNANTDTIVVESCIRKANENSDRRFLFDITSCDRTLTLQSLSDDDRKQWLEVMEGREPIYMESSELALQNEGVTVISEIGMEFCRKCMDSIEKRGLDDQGLYRVAGVNSKFTKLVQIGLDPKQADKLDLISEESSWEIKTITSAMKQYFRNLSDPLLTYKFHQDFLQAIRLDTHAKKISRLQELLQMLPQKHYQILKRLMYHLKLVAEHSDKNLMQASNLGVVLGPTLMRPREETMAAIMNIKYQSIVIENVIQEYDQLFIDSFQPNVDYRKGSSSSSSNDVSSTSSKESVDSPSPKHTAVPTVSAPPAGSSSPRDKAGKYRAPIPPTAAARPVIPKAKKESEQLSALPIALSNAIPKSASNGSISSGKGGSLEGKPSRPAAPISPLPLPKPAHGKMVNRFDVAIGSFSSPSNTAAVVVPADVSADSKSSRRTSYQMALDEQIDTPVNNTSQKPSLPPPIKTKPSKNSIKGPPITPRKEWTVKALYPCAGENDGELSFEAGAVITNVRISSEQGWLIGTLNGKTGLIPQNYTEPVD